MSIYYYVYGLSNVGSLKETAEVLARVLGMPFQKRNSDWVGDYCIARNEDRTEQIRLLDDSGEESYWSEDYGHYDLFLEVSVDSLERVREIEKCFYEAREPLQQAYLKHQQAYRERLLQSDYFKKQREREVGEEKERLESWRASLMRGEDPFAARFPDLAKKNLQSMGPQKYREHLMASWERGVLSSEKRLAKDPFPIILKEPEIVLLKRKD